ncbi:NAD(P)/FAD-dependent oxidoreductase [Aurantiacibacter sediminis]|uniref:FAD-dependent oxidoreductase n=1 Tax=Aurantiacibacter sediminis TaxID=2793064 RepID=A0ABS0N6R9_9SPHN|nr:FAD-dependent oxidoreductase [Aurantiacibacter sediminis]MBH5323455.1 FAD-dependent oxidoreductase [Aurantiacibacter sediminis]
MAGDPKDSANQRAVIIGGGQAASQMVEEVRRHGWQGEVVLVSEEAELPYCRPPLSKSFLVKDYNEDWLQYRPASFYEKHNVALKLGVSVDAINRDAQLLALSDGSTLTYDRLAIATGARVRKLDIAGAENRGVYYIRTLDDVRQIREHLAEARNVVVIGAGFIGLESAAALVATGRQVTVLSSGEQILPRAVPLPVASFLERYHQHNGVKIERNVTTSEIRRDDQAGLCVCTADGRHFAADLVLVGIGILPNEELASRAGLAVANGIVVDEYGVTSDPAIVAAGDCTNHPNPLMDGHRLRLETVHNAIEQSKTAAASIAGKQVIYAQTPWVWSDQYDLRLQSVGVPGENSEFIVRGDPETGPEDGQFAVFHFVGDRFTAYMCINRPGEFGAARRMLDSGVSLTREQAADPSYVLDNVVPRKVVIDFDEAWLERSERKKQLAATSWPYSKAETAG